MRNEQTTSDAITYIDKLIELLQLGDRINIIQRLRFLKMLILEDLESCKKDIEEIK